MRVIIALLACLIFIGCKKTDAPDPDLPLNTFSFGHVQYTPTEFDPNGPNEAYWGTGSGKGSGISVYIRSKISPAKEGSYKVVKGSDTTHEGVAVVLMYERSGSTLRYWQPSVHEQKKLQVSFDNGLMVVSLPKVWCKVNGSNDSVQVSAFLKRWY